MHFMIYHRLGLISFKRHKMLNNQESLSVRYAQCFGIVSVVLGHYAIKPLDVLQPYVFHMPLFFLIGGLLFKDRCVSKVIMGVLKKHIMYIVYTFVIISLIAVYLRDSFGLWVGNIYPEKIEDSIVWTLQHNFHNNNYFLVGWFLFAYAIVSIICAVLLKIKSKIIISILAIALGYIGMEYVSPLYFENKLQAYNLLSQVMVGSMFYLLGFLFKGELLKLASPYIPIISIAILFTMKSYSILLGMGMSGSSYPHGFYAHTVSSLLCVATIFTITNILSQMPVKFNLLSLIGNQSKVIMSYHLLAFTCADFFFYKLGMYDISKTAALKHFVSPQYWYFYPLAGIGLPLLLAVALLNAKKIHMNISIQQLKIQNGPH